MKEFDLSEYVTAAEQHAKQRRLDADTKARMGAEAHRLAGAIADALFGPYVGRRIRISKPARLLRGVVRSYTKLVPGLIPVREDFLAKHPHFTGATEAEWAEARRAATITESYGTQGWELSVDWTPARGMLATLHRVTDASYEKNLDVTGQLGADIGTQARQIAAAFAEEMGKRLILDDEK